MDTLTFISRLVEAMAWPLTIILALCLLRRPVSEQIGKLLKLKYKDFELSFKEGLENAERQAESLALPNIEHLQGDIATRRNGIVELLDISPRSAVLEAWAELEASVGNALVRRGIISRERRDSGIRFRVSGRKVFAEEPAYLEMFLRLLDLRNQAVHAIDDRILRDEAESYVEVAMRLVEHVNRKWLSDETENAT